MRIYLSLCHSLLIAYFYIFDHGRSSFTNEKDHHYFLNRFVCVGEFFDG